jgi:hypothetical protein
VHCQYSLSLAPQLAPSADVLFFAVLVFEERLATAVGGATC